MRNFIFTFGSNQLQEISHIINPMDVMLVVKGESENEARREVFDSFIGNKFCISYSYEDVAEEFGTKYGMIEYSIDDLEQIRG
jgi:hypothetical protein